MAVPVISGDVTTIISGGGLILMGVVGYFLKKTHQKIDENCVAVQNLGNEFKTKVEEVEENFYKRVDRLEEKLEVETKAVKAEIVQIFQDICHERQDACGRLQTARLDAATLVSKNCCIKIQKVIEDRDKKWEKQEQLNEEVKKHLYKRSDDGRTWELRDGR